MRREHKTKNILPPPPAGYRWLEYLESTGTQYIRTNITGANEHWKWHIIVKPTYTNHTYCILHGLYNVTGNRRIYALLGTTDSQQTTVFDYVCGSSYSRVEVSAIPIDTIIDVFEDFNSVIINGATYSLTKYNNSRTNMVMLMGSWMGSGANDHPMGDGQYHLFEIWDANDVLKLQGVPALRISDSKPGLYDIVNNQFYTNAGTSEFLYN